jgi:hypothetical protein
MKRLVLAAITLFALAGIGSVAPAQEYRGPKILVDQLKYHMGKVTQGALAEHVFEIHNVGTDALIIDRIQSS